MRRGALLLLSLLMSAPACADGDEADSSEVVPYGCNDVVVVGRVNNLSFTHIEKPDDILGHGWITAQLRIKKLLKGHAAGRILPVKYFAHTYMRENRDFLFVLSPVDGGSYEIIDGRLFDGARRAILAAKCE